MLKRRPRYTTVEWYEMLRFAQHDNRGVITCHAERSAAESKHLSAPMPNVHWITVVYLGEDHGAIDGAICSGLERGLNEELSDAE